MRILTTLPQDDLTGVPAAARAAEAAGYDSLVTSENRNDPFLSLGIAAVNTSRRALHRHRDRVLAQPDAGGQREVGPDVHRDLR